MANFPIVTTIPAANNDPADDQPLMQQNFANINGYLQVDHTNPSSSIAGVHKQVQMPVGVDFPNVAGQGTLYSKFASVTGVGTFEQLFWRFASGALPPLQITGPFYSAGPNGYVSLMNAIILQWGSVSAAQIPNNQAVTFSFTFPNNVYTVLITGQTGSTNDKTINITDGSLTTSGFTLKTSGSSSFTKVYWLAIGN